VSEEHLRELVDREFKVWCERRENDFWTFLAQGKPSANVQEIANRIVEASGSVEAHILVEKFTGKVYVNCGKLSKIGHCEIEPSFGERNHSLGAALDAEGKVRAWQEIPVLMPVTCRNFSGSGDLKSETRFTVPSDLIHGVWAVRRDEQGIYFSPVIYYQNGEIEIPEETNVVVRESFAVTAVAAPVPEDTGVLVFKSRGGRHFECPSCGYVERLTKEEYSWYLDGDIVEIECPGCGKAGEVRK
jgi:hypothetical protein